MSCVIIGPCKTRVFLEGEMPFLHCRTGKLSRRKGGKLYEETGTNTDGAMTQKAVTELFGNLKDAAGAAFRTVFTKI